GDDRHAIPDLLDRPDSRRPPQPEHDHRRGGGQPPGEPRHPAARRRRRPLPALQLADIALRGARLHGGAPGTLDQSIEVGAGQASPGSGATGAADGARSSNFLNRASSSARAWRYRLEAVFVNVPSTRPASSAVSSWIAINTKASRLRGDSVASARCIATSSA